MKTLTTLQQSLIDGLINEFTKINPKPSDNNSKRFSFNTIDECKREETRFFETIKKHNNTMVKVFTKQLDEEIKTFKEEFGSEFRIQLGYNSLKYSHNTYEQFIEANQDNATNQSSNEIHLFIVSKKTSYTGGSGYNQCNDYDYEKLFVDFKREVVRITLESGKEISGYKIIGLLFSERYYLYRENGLSASTFDDLIQTSKNLQKRMIAITV